MKISHLTYTQEEAHIKRSVTVNIFPSALFYTIDRAYESFVEKETYDAFVIALIPFMLENSEDLYVDGIVDEVLLTHLNTQFLPQLAVISKCKKTPQISAKHTQRSKAKNSQIGTGFSCGVDSFTTLYDFIQSKISVRYVTFLDAGSHGKYGKEHTKQIKEFRRQNAAKAAQRLDMEMICISSNISSFVTSSFESSHSLVNLSCVYHLSNLYSDYYYSSAFSEKQSTLKGGDTSNWDSLLLPYISSSYLTIKSTALDKTRLQRTAFISEENTVQNYLDVCTNSLLAKERGYQNCSSCHKCAKTMTSLALLDRLSQFGNVFDLNRYVTTRDMYISTYLLQKKLNPIDQEILDTLKEKKEVVLKHYFSAFVFRLKKNIKKILKK